MLRAVFKGEVLAKSDLYRVVKGENIIFVRFRSIDVTCTRTRPARCVVGQAPGVWAAIP